MLIINSDGRRSVGEEDDAENIPFFLKNNSSSKKIVSWDIYLPICVPTFRKYSLLLGVFLEDTKLTLGLLEREWIEIFLSMNFLI